MGDVRTSGFFLSHLPGAPLLPPASPALAAAPASPALRGVERGAGAEGQGAVAQLAVSLCVHAMPSLRQALMAGFQLINRALPIGLPLES